MRVKLVSFAEGEPFSTVLRLLNDSSRQAGFDEVQLWSMADFLNSPLVRKHPEAMNRLKRLQHRPYCDAFKMVALLQAMEHSDEGDYVLWIDSSRHFPYALPRGNVHKAIAKLNHGATQPRSIYGRTNCVGNYGVPELEVPIETKSHPASAFANYFRKQRPVLGTIVACHILLANTKFNRRLVREWLEMALRMPEAFCGHHTEDNFAWMALVCNHSLPSIINQPTAQLDSAPARFTWAPLSPQFLLQTLENGAFRHVPNACGEQKVRDACRSWVYDDTRSRRMTLDYEPQRFYSPEYNTCVSNETKWSAAIRTSLVASTEPNMDFVGPCQSKGRKGAPRRGGG